MHIILLFRQFPHSSSSYILHLTPTASAEDVELIREFVSEAAINGAIRGGMSNLTEMAQTFDWRARGYDEAITVDAGMGYFDDRVDRRIARYVSLSENTPFV